MAVLVKFSSFYCWCFSFFPLFPFAPIKCLGSEQNAPNPDVFSDSLSWTRTLTSIAGFSPDLKASAARVHRAGQTRSLEVRVWWRSDRVLFRCQANQLESLNDCVLISLVMNAASCGSRIVGFGSVSARRKETRRQGRLNERWLCPTWDSLIRRRGPK